MTNPKTTELEHTTFAVWKTQLIGILTSQGQCTNDLVSHESVVIGEQVLCMCAACQICFFVQPIVLLP